MTAENASLYGAATAVDPDLETTVITLSYHDPENKERDITVGIAPELGSNMYRLRVGGSDLIHTDLSLAKQKGFTGSFVLWPFPNRIRNKQYMYQGQHYSLTDVERKVEDLSLVHGIVLDRAWQYSQPVIDAKGVSVETYVDIERNSPHYGGYPFRSRLVLTYRLEQEGVTVKYRVQNRGENVLPFGFALHPYFSTITGLENTFISLPASSVMEADQALLPTGRMLAVDSVMYGMFDLREPIAVSRLKLDHVYSDLEQNIPAVVVYRGAGLQMHISATSDFTHCVVYAPGDNNPFFCLEYQTCSTDAINLQNQGPALKEVAHLMEVGPGESREGALQYTFLFSEPIEGKGKKK